MSLTFLGFGITKLVHEIDLSGSSYPQWPEEMVR
jgi:hypothetical protein